MPTSPPFDTELKKKYEATDRLADRVRIMHDDFRKQSVVREYLDAKDTRAAFLMKLWAPTIDFCSPQFSSAVGDETIESNFSGPRGYHIGAVAIHYVLKVASPVIITIVFCIGFFGLESILGLFGASKYSAPGRNSWLVPDAIYGSSTPVALGAFMFAVFAPFAGLIILAIIAAIPTIAVSLICDLGIIPSLRYFILIVGLLTMLFGISTLRASRGFIEKKRAADSFFTQYYLPVLSRYAHDAAVEDIKSEEKARMDAIRDQVWQDKLRYESRNNSDRDYQSFLDAEQGANHLGRSTIPGVHNTAGFPIMGSRSLSELIRDRHTRPPSPQELAQAAGISIEDASIVLRGGLGLSQQSNLSGPVSNLYDTFNS